MYQLCSLSKTIDNNLLFNNLTCELPDTGIVIFKGENGSGKTTLIHMLLTLDEDYTGDIFYHDRKLSGFSEQEKSDYLRNDVAVLFQKDNFLSFIKPEDGIKKTNREKVVSPSQGERMRGLLDEVLHEEKKVYLLDECLACLDAVSKAVYIKKIEEIAKHSLVILVTHDIQIVHYTLMLEFRKGRDVTIVNGDFLGDKETVLSNHKRSLNPVPLMIWKNIRRNKILYLFHTILLAVVVSLTFFGGSIFQTFRPAYNEILSSCNYCMFTINNQFSSVMDNAPFEASKMIQTSDEKIFVLDDMVQDEFVHVSPSLEIQDKQHVEFYDKKLDLVLDSKYDDKWFHISSKLYSEATDYDVFQGECWNTQEHTSSYLCSHCQIRDSSIHFVRKSYLEEKKGFSIDVDLENDTLYTSRSGLLSDSKVYFDSKNITINSSEIDYSEVFPKGLNTKFLDLGNLNDGFFMEYVVLSDDTFEMIKNHKYGTTDYLVRLSDDNRQICDFLVNHRIAISASKPMLKKDASVAKINEQIDRLALHQNAVLSQAAFFSYGYLFILSIVVLFLLVFLMPVFINKTKFNDAKLLYVKGYRKLQILTILYAPTMISLFVSYFVGYGFALLETLSDIEYVLWPTLPIILVLMSYMLLSGLISWFILRKRR